MSWAWGWGRKMAMIAWRRFRLHSKIISKQKVSNDKTHCPQKMMWFLRQQYSMCWCQSKALLHVIAWAPPYTASWPQRWWRDWMWEPWQIWQTERFLNTQQPQMNPRSNADAKGLLTVCARVTGWLLTALVLNSMLTLPAHTSTLPRTQQPCLRLLSSASGLWWVMDCCALLHMPSPLFLHKCHGLILENSPTSMLYLHFRTVMYRILDLQSDRWGWWL